MAASPDAAATAILVSWLSIRAPEAFISRPKWRGLHPDRMVGGHQVNILEHSRFEKARIIGARALQLSMGAPPLIAVDDPVRSNPVDIAMTEYESDAIPLTVRRTTTA